MHHGEISEDERMEEAAYMSNQNAARALRVQGYEAYANGNRVAVYLTPDEMTPGNIKQVKRTLRGIGYKSQLEIKPRDSWIEIPRKALKETIDYSISEGRKEGYVDCIDWIMDHYHDDVRPEVVVELWLKKRELEKIEDE